MIALSGGRRQQWRCCCSSRRRDGAGWSPRRWITAFVPRRPARRSGRRAGGGCGVPHVALAGVLPDRSERTANLSRRGRATLRYRLLEEHARRDRRALGSSPRTMPTTSWRRWRCGWRAGRGCAGFPASGRGEGRMARPLLGWRRAELGRDRGGMRGAVPVEDPVERRRPVRPRSRAQGTGRGRLAGCRGRIAQRGGAGARPRRRSAGVVDGLAGERCRIGDGASARCAPTICPPSCAGDWSSSALRRIDPAAAPRAGGRGTRARSSGERRGRGRSAACATTSRRGANGAFGRLRRAARTGVATCRRHRRLFHCH